MKLQSLADARRADTFVALGCLFLWLLFLASIASAQTDRLTAQGILTVEVANLGFLDFPFQCPGESPDDPISDSCKANCFKCSPAEATRAPFNLQVSDGSGRLSLNFPGEHGAFSGCAFPSAARVSSSDLKILPGATQQRVEMVGTMTVKFADVAGRPAFSSSEHPGSTLTLERGDEDWVVELQVAADISTRRDDGSNACVQAFFGNQDPNQVGPFTDACLCNSLRGVLPSDRVEIDLNG